MLAGARSHIAITPSNFPLWHSVINSSLFLEFVLISSARDDIELQALVALHLTLSVCEGYESKNHTQFDFTEQKRFWLFLVHDVKYRKLLTKCYQHWLELSITAASSVSGYQYTEIMLRCCRAVL
jgi:hypothetical protein